MNIIKLIMNKKNSRDAIWLCAAAVLAFITLLSCILYFVFFPDNLMHSDMAAEVMLSKLLSEEGRLISKNWFYSTEIRIVYTQLLMTPLFCFIRDFGTVKLISIIVYDVALVIVFYYTAKSFDLQRGYLFLMMALLVAPLSNEYFDMLLLGNFYTSQAICTFLVLLFFYRTNEKTSFFLWLKRILLCIAALILGLSGLRYPASLFVPIVISVFIPFVPEYHGIRHTPAIKAKKQKISALLENQIFCRLFLAVVMTLCSGIGVLINKLYLEEHYSFDTTPVEFVPMNEIPSRFLKSMQLMIEFVGQRDAAIWSRLWFVNIMKIAFLLMLVFAIGYLTKNRHTLLKEKQRMLLYYFYGLFIINWFMLIFTNVLQQYRYWLPVYIIAIILLGIYLQNAVKLLPVVRLFCICLSAITVPASLYGELWQDTKYNDCEKRYGYMEFLEEQQYTFGYATFWNADVTEYLSNGEIHVGNLGGDEDGSAPYEWLSRKEYYKEGYHTGKTFLLLARTEEPALFNGDITIMTDSTKVYEDEYYVIYEGEGMYLFSK